MEEIILVDKPITKTELEAIAQNHFGDMVKGVADLEKGIMALGGELHADEEAYLLKNGSAQENLWGFNIYPGGVGGEFIEFDSMINIRPAQNNLTRTVADPGIQDQIRKIVAKLVL